MKLVTFFFILLLILSCTLQSQDVFTFNNPKFSNMKEACLWVNKNISYKKDYYDEWKTPQQTLDEGKGDCEDMALLLMAIINYQKKEKSKLIIIEISNENSIYHAIVNKGNKYYDATNGKTTNSIKHKIVETYNYESAMYLATNIKNY